MIDNPGYVQAVENLAYYIQKLSNETQIPIVLANPHILELSDDEQVDFCREQMSPEENAQWGLLEDAFVVTGMTYNVEAEQLNNDVSARMMLYDIQAGLFDED